MPRLEAVVASADEATRTRVVQVIVSGGHGVVAETGTSMEALELCLDRGVDVAVLDEQMRPVGGADLARILTGLRPRLTPIVLSRVDLEDDTGLLALDPELDGFEVALENALARLAAGP